MRLLAVAVLTAGLVPMGAARAVQPIHAYEFAVDASDSVGTADGDLQAGASIVGGRLELDGTDDYVSFGTRLIPTSGDFSVFIRVNGLPNLGAYTEIISQGTSGGPGFYIGTAPGGGIRLGDALTSSGVAFPTGEVELLLTSGSGGARFYVDGTLQFSSVARAANGAGGIFTYFGRQFDPYDEYFRGSIDAIRIYGSAILPGDVVEPAAGVPEPASWAMLIAGFGLTGAAMRRRRTGAITAR
ncbi:MAG: LamG domain-containing protein [Sandarakinorhabdus sp.]|nr:LamG domain-containing protein [Sandarakinorhabdus sp.]